MKHSTIFKIDVLIIAVSLISIVVIFGYRTPLVISPVDNFETTNQDILFTIENADKILIDDNIDFTSPEEFNLNEKVIITLEPGTYYWKAVGILKSDMRTLTINSRIELKLKKTDVGFNVVNAGNSVLKVDVYDESGIFESFDLNVYEEKQIRGNKVEGMEK